MLVIHGLKLLDQPLRSSWSLYYKNISSMNWFYWNKKLNILWVFVLSSIWCYKIFWSFIVTKYKCLLTNLKLCVKCTKLPCGTILDAILTHKPNCFHNDSIVARSDWLPWASFLRLNAHFKYLQLKKIFYSN